VSRIYEPKGVVTGGWRKLHIEELHNLYSSANIMRVIKSKRMRLAGHVARKGKIRGRYRILVRKPEDKRPRGRPRYRYEDNVKMDIGERVCDDLDRVQWRAHVNTVINLRVL